jgi:hypothetical protein
MIRWSKPGLLLATLLVPLPAGAGDVAVTIDFEGVAPAGDDVFFNPTFVVDGYDFTGINAALTTDFRVMSESYPDDGIDAPSDYGFVQNPSAFRIERSGGEAFDLVELKAAQIFFIGAGNITFVGIRRDGGETHRTEAIADGVYTTYTFDETWRDLVVVTVTSDDNFLAVDDVELESGIFVDGFEGGFVRWIVGPPT